MANRNKIEDIFHANSMSLGKFLRQGVRGFYIPSYQRPYSWDKGHISRLYEDILLGINQLARGRNSISFLGTIITIQDEETYASAIPSPVLMIIDGQQRICTAMMTNIALHQKIKELSSRYRRESEPCFQAVVKESDKLLNYFCDSYQIKEPEGNGKCLSFPRLIKAQQDIWPTRDTTSKYESPIAKLLFKYIERTDQPGDGPFKFDFHPSAEEKSEEYKNIINRFKLIQTEIDSISKGERSARRSDFPALDKCLKQDLLGIKFNRAMKNSVSGKLKAQENGDFCALLRLIVFAKYFMGKVAITVVEAGGEKKAAFDIFDALNTTGEPLTAFETLKPKVVNLETQERYESSPSCKKITKIETYLGGIGNAREKRKITSNMLVSFALAETGKALEKSSDDQRHYLRSEFDNLTSNTNALKKGRDFIHSLVGVSLFFQYSWQSESADSQFMPLNIQDKEALVGFEMLRGLGHSITIAPLSRFHQYAVDAGNSDREKRTLEFIAALKATVAFSALWRSIKRGTKGIDGHYRRIMRGEVTRPGSKQIPPLARRRPAESKSGIPSLSNYKKALRLVLEESGAIKNRTDWINKVSNAPIHEYSPLIARFILFCAFHDSVAGEKGSGLITSGRPNTLPMLRLEQWNNEAYSTIEHIAPQDRSAGWPEDIYNESQTVHTLGNLTLLAPDENQSLDNKNWKQKKIMYGLLSSKTKKEFDERKLNCNNAGLQLGRKFEEMSNQAGYRDIFESIASYDQDWALDIINTRSRRLATLAADRLYSWLE